MAELGAFVGGMLFKLGVSLLLGLKAMVMGTVFATLLIARLRAARSLKHAFRMGLVAGLVIGAVFVVVGLVT